MKKINFVLGAVLSSALILSGCAGSSANAKLSAPQTIKIAVEGPISGQYAKIGMDALSAVRYAVDEFNAKGSLKNVKIEAVAADDEGDPAKGMTVADRMAQDKSVVAVIGPMNSNVVNAVFPTYERSSLPMVSQSATTSNLSEQGYTTFFRICPRDDAQGPAAAHFIAQDLKAKKVTIIDDKGTYGQGLAAQVDSVLKQAGVATQRIQITQADRDFASLVTMIKGQQPELVYLAISNPGQAATLIKQARSQGMTAQFMGGEALREQDEFIKGAEGQAEGVYLTALSPNLENTDQGKQFLKGYLTKYGATSMFTGQSYEATNIILAAIEKAAAKGNIDRKAVLAALKETKDYQGVLGIPITFDKKGDLAGAAIYVEKVDKGTFAPVKVAK